MKVATKHPFSGQRLLSRTPLPSRRVLSPSAPRTVLQASVRHASAVLCVVYLLCGVTLPFLLAGTWVTVELSPVQERLGGIVMILLGLSLFAAYDAANQRR